MTAIAKKHLHQEASAPAGGDLPVSLHPVIDPNACICSGACITACPEGDIIQLINGAARLVNANHCIGHGACASACPVDAIRLVFGSSERGVDLPDLQPGFESSRPGVHVVGELGGMGLIKNALRQGLEVGAYLQTKIGVRQARQDFYDVIIVGAGPAGLATALACRQRGLSFFILDQGSFGGTVANYPRHKVVMTESIDLPYYGRFGASTIQKEALLAIWQQAANKANIAVHEHTMLQDIKGVDGAFEVITSNGPVRGSKVVLACGRRGTPKKLEVPGEELPHVAYGLVNPEQYNSSAVLVIGGGDVALESAIMLSEQSSARVALSYRGDRVRRARAANLEKIESLIASGRVQAFFESTVSEVTPSSVRLKQRDRELTLPMNYLLVHVGGTLPDAMLKKLEISCKRHFGEDAQPIPGHTRDDVEHSMPILYAGLAKFLLSAFCLVSLLLLAVLAWSGWHYYQAPVAARPLLPQHTALRPTGSIGKTIGVISTFVMSLNFLYAVRKRFKRLQNFGELRDWLNLHMVIGVITPVFVAFHAAFQSNNMVATGTALALTVVVLTGLFGRFLYALAPTENDKMTALPELLAGWEKLRYQTHLDAQSLQMSEDFVHLSAEFLAVPASSPSLLASIVRLWLTFLSVAQDLFRVRRYFKNLSEWSFFALRLGRLLHLRLQIAAYEPLRRLLQTWRGMHIALSSALVLIMALHIGVAIYLGYGWTFR